MNNAPALEEAVLNDIRSHALAAMEDRENYIRQVLLSMDANALQEQSRVEQELERLKSEARTGDQQFIQLYNDLSKGILSEKRF